MKEHYIGFGHAAIYTEDIEKSIAFYENIGGSLQQRGGVNVPEGEKKLALVEFGGFLIELIQSPTPMKFGDGSLTHIAVLVDDLDKTISELQAAGTNTFISEKKVLPDTFGGLQNIFFTGPSGEQIELLQML